MFEAVIMREDRTQGFFTSFELTKHAMHEIDACFRGLSSRSPSAKSGTDDRAKTGLTSQRLKPSLLRENLPQR
jgi:hypothetical protein